MEFQLPKCFYCPICYELYDEETRIPIIIPCGNGHTICSTCVVNAWGEDGKFSCPFDKTEFFYYTGIVNELARNRVVLEALEEIKTDYCSQHSSRRLDLICKPCQSMICSACHLRGPHEGHQILLTEEFEEEAERVVQTIRKYLSDIEEIFKKIIAMINRRQVSLEEMINNKFHSYIEKLDIKDFLKQQIGLYFGQLKKEIHSTVLSDDTATRSILGWKGKAKELIEGNGSKSTARNFELVNLEQKALELGISSWLEDKEQRIKILEIRLDEMGLEFEKELQIKIASRNNETQPKPEFNTDATVENQGIQQTVEDNQAGAGRNPDEPEEPGSSTIPKRESLVKKFDTILEFTISQAHEVKNFESHIHDSLLDGSLRHLNELRINCERLNEEEALIVLNCISEVSNLKILDLQLGWCKTINDDTTACLCQNIEKLHSLNVLEIKLPGCDRITDRSLDIIAQSLPKLHNLTSLSLDFGMCLRITDLGIVGLGRKITYLPKLVQLRLTFPGCSGITDHGITRLTGYLSRINEMEDLQLSFTLCKEITDFGVSIVCQNIAKLQKLDQLQLRFIGCSNVTVKGQDYVRQLLSTFKNFV